MVKRTLKLGTLSIDEKIINAELTEEALEELNSLYLDLKIEAEEKGWC